MIDAGNQHVDQVAFSPDGTRLLTAGWDTRVNLWDVGSGELLRTFSEHQFTITGIGFIENGTSLISTDGGGFEKVSSIESNDSVTILQQGNDLMKVCISNADGHIATGNGRTVVIRDAEENVLRSFDGHKKLNIQQLSFSPNGRLLAVAGDDGVVDLWDPNSGKPIRKLEKHTGSVQSLAFTPDGTKLVTGGLDGQVFVWNLATGDQIWALEGHRSKVYAVACSPDGKVIATSSRDKSIFIWDAKTGERIHHAKLKKRGMRGPGYQIFRSITFSPDSKRIFAGTQASEIYIIDCKTGKDEARFLANSTSINAITFSPDHSRLITGSTDHTIRIWDPKTHEELRVLNGHTGHVESLCFNRIGTKLYSSSRDGTVRVWDATPASK